MKRFWPLILIGFGVLIIFSGFVYDVLFAGIPYQDPTPALTAKYNLHSQIASIIRWIGAVLCFLGVAGTLIRRATSKRK